MRVVMDVVGVGGETVMMGGHRRLMDVGCCAVAVEDRGEGGRAVEVAGLMVRMRRGGGLCVPLMIENFYEYFTN